jgi:glycosyltransferase involved in cell wall biosynthesis
MTAQDRSPQDPIRICIVSHFARGAMLGGAQGHAGGVERQTSLLARWLASRGHDVSFVTWNEGDGSETTVDGVRMLSVCAQDDGVYGIRFFHPRWSSLNRALARADADVYYHNCGDYFTGQVALWCRRHGRPFVYSVANDPDVDPAFPKLKAWRERKLYSYGLRHADRVIAQTTTQQQMLANHFGLPSEVIPMPCPGPTASEFVPPDPPAAGSARLVWVARIAKVKRLEWLLDIAPALPDVRIDVAGTPQAGDAYAADVMARVSRLPNVAMLGRVSREGIPDLFKGAAALICTSEYEGFPNTFLEGWSHGIPLVSTHDPDGLVTRQRLGRIATTLPTFIAAIRELLASPTSWREMSSNARAYYSTNHTVEATMPMFEREFLSAVHPKGRADTR